MFMLQMDTSAVIDMEVMNGDESDYETNFADQSGEQYNFLSSGILQQCSH